MRCETCDQDPCVCLKSTTPVFRNTYHSQSLGITRDEFGRNLYEAIKRVGAIKQLQHYLTILLEDPPALTIMREREQEKRKELAAIMPTLTDQEAFELRSRYPEVTTW